MPSPIRQAYTRLMQFRYNKQCMAACALVVIVTFGSACATTGSDFRRPEPPKNRTVSKSLQLFMPDDGYVLERGTPLLLTMSKGQQNIRGPIVLYGTDYRGEVVTGYEQTGQLQSFPIADIQHIQVIKDGKVGWGLGIGTLVGLAISFAIPSICKQESEDGSCRNIDGPATGIPKTLTFLGFALIGTVVGVLLSIDANFPIGETRWQIRH